VTLELVVRPSNISSILLLLLLLLLLIVITIIIPVRHNNSVQEGHLSSVSVFASLPLWSPVKKGVRDTYVLDHRAYDVGQFLLPVLVGEVVVAYLLAHGEIPQFQEFDVSVLGDETLSGFSQRPIPGEARGGRGVSPWALF
jgi:hypothetical protein